MNKLHAAMVAFAILVAVLPSFAVVVRRNADARGTTNWLLAISTAPLQVLPVLFAMLFIIGLVFGLVVSDHPDVDLIALGTLVITTVTKILVAEPLRDIEAWTLVQVAAVIGTLMWFWVRGRYRPRPLIGSGDRDE